MPRHKFDGTWRFFRMGHAPGQFPKPDDELDIRKADPRDGRLDPGSKVKGKAITGKITGKRLEFEHPEGTGTKKVYDGRLFFDEAGYMIVSGVFNLADSDTALRKRRRARDQDDGTWTGIRP